MLLFFPSRATGVQAGRRGAVRVVRGVVLPDGGAVVRCAPRVRRRGQGGGERGYGRGGRAVWRREAVHVRQRHGMAKCTKVYASR